MPGVKLTFIFSPQPTWTAAPPEERVRTSITLPDQVKERPELRDEVLKLAQSAAYFTQYSLFVNCPEAALHNHSVVQREPGSPHAVLNAAQLHFEGLLNGHLRRKVKLLLYAPIMSPFQNLRVLYRLDFPRYSADQQDYIHHMRALVEPLLTLLNGGIDQWFFTGFEPRLWQNRQAKRLNRLGTKRCRAAKAAERQQQRLAQKIATQAAQTNTEGAALGPSTHGAGRMTGARPGVYKGVQMRSQLEISFAAELDERGIQWVYEGEALGAAQYLVDFYLPALGAWVEVKGQLGAKDRQVLPEVAETLKVERGQRLLLYSNSGKCYVVNPSGLRAIERKHFWTELMK